MRIDLRAKPFFLNDQQIAWVNTTLDSMSEDDKLRQSRVALTRATNQVLRTALHLICMQSPEKI